MLARDVIAFLYSFMTSITSFGVLSQLPNLTDDLTLSPNHRHHHGNGMVGVLSSRRSCCFQYHLVCFTRSETGAAQSEGQTQTETGESSTAEESTVSRR